MTLRSKTADRTTRIIRAAAQLFARQGYHGTSTRDIARLAEMSENTLFRHFEHKEDIFWAALRAGLNELRLRKDLLDSIAECDVPEVVLPKILGTLVDTLSFKAELLCLIAVAMIEMRWKAETICHEYLAPIFVAFNRYLSMNIKSGRIRHLDPCMITAALGMTVLLHPGISRLINGEPPPHSDSHDAIRAYTKFWLDALVPLTANDSASAMEVADSTCA